MGRAGTWLGLRVLITKSPSSLTGILSCCRSVPQAGGVNGGPTAPEPHAPWFLPPERGLPTPSLVLSFKMAEKDYNLWVSFGLVPTAWLLKHSSTHPSCVSGLGKDISQGKQKRDFVNKKKRHLPPSQSRQLICSSSHTDLLFVLVFYTKYTYSSSSGRASAAWLVAMSQTGMRKVLRPQKRRVRKEVSYVCHKYEKGWGSIALGNLCTYSSSLINLVKRLKKREELHVFPRRITNSKNVSYWDLDLFPSPGTSVSVCRQQETRRGVGMTEPAQVTLHMLLWALAEWNTEQYIVQDPGLINFIMLLLNFYSAPLRDRHCAGLWEWKRDKEIAAILKGLFV